MRPDPPGIPTGVERQSAAFRAPAAKDPLGCAVTHINAIIGAVASSHEFGDDRQEDEMTKRWKTAAITILMITLPSGIVHAEDSSLGSASLSGGLSSGGSTLGARPANRNDFYGLSGNSVCEQPIYNSWGAVVGFRQGDCL